MAKKYLDDNGLLYLWGKIKEKFALKTHTHTKSEITDFPTTMPPTSHTHGNITNAGALQTTDVAIANGDKLVITDSSNSSKVARASLSFDGATTTKALTQKGTWETFLTSEDVPEGASASGTTPKMDGTAAVGTETSFARGDHVHPTDTSRAASSHSHGHILNDGSMPYLVSNSTTIANNDRFLIIDYDDTGKIKLPSIKFDGSTATKALTQKGTWETFSTDGEANVLEGVQMNGTDLTIDANKKVNVPVFTGSTSSANGTVGLVPAPLSGDPETKYLSADGSFHQLILSKSVGSSAYLITLHKDSSSTANKIAEVTLSAASTTQMGMMSKDDKSKLDSISMTNGVIDSSCLPSFVDDVIEAYARTNQTELGSTWLSTTSASGSALTPETGKIYVILNSSTNYDANSQFRWSGSTYVLLSYGGVSSITNTEIDTILAS